MMYTVERESLVETQVAPAATRLVDGQTLVVDFGKAAYGTLMVVLPSACRTLVVHLGEKLNADGRIDRTPPGTIRYRRIEQVVESDASVCRLIIPADKRNTGPAAIKMPAAIGEVYPFRYAEIEDAAGIAPESIRQIFVHYPFDDAAATFDSSDPILNAVWELCKYSIKATTFCGVYVDGDRERIPYEGDAYINQLSHYCVDHEYAFARYSHEYMLTHPTWCTEWHLHSVMMAWADYLYSGEIRSIEAFYDVLRAKTLIDFARADGLISVAPELRTAEMAARLEPHFEAGIIKRDIRDVLDWPPGSFTEGGTGERDNHEMLPINTVINAFHAHALELMGRMAGAIGRTAQGKRFSERARMVAERINTLLFDSGRGVYIDGEGAQHASLHSNMFMLAFGLVPDDRLASVIAFIKSRGMACSVYGAQHLLEGLYQHGEGQYALELMQAQHDRGWWNMLQAGSTMTLEAWDLKYKNNLDWNHAWGAAPANLVGRYLLGVRPLEPGFVKALIQPQPGDLTYAAGTVPTPLGGIGVSLNQAPGAPFELAVDIPAGVTARVGVPHVDPESCVLVLNGAEVEAELARGTLFLDGIGAGRHVVCAPVGERGHE